MKIELVDYAKLKVNYSLRTRIYVSTLNKKWCFKYTNTEENNGRG